MLSFRQKIFFSHLLIFICFLGLMILFVQRTVQNIVIGTLEEQANELVTQMQSSVDEFELISKLREYQGQIGFRFSIIDSKMRVLYNSHEKRFMTSYLEEGQVAHYPEVKQAMQSEVGYHETYSEALDQDIAYLAKTFEFQNEVYVLRMAFPLQFVNEIKNSFEIGFLLMGAAILLLFSLVTWFILHTLSRPILQILRAITPYQEGKIDVIPTIDVKQNKKLDEFGHLAKTLNSLSLRVQRQILKLSQAQQEKEILLQSLSEGVIGIDDKQMIDYVNEEALIFLERKETDVLTHPIRDFLPIATQIDTCLTSQKPTLDTLTIQTKKGEIVLDIGITPKQSKTGAVIVLQDRSEHHKLMQIQRDFVANASHELKTPITIIHGFAETLHDNLNLPKEKLQEITEKIVKNCKRMTTLIQDLLALTDLEYLPQDRLISCHVEDILHHCASIIQDAYPKAKITIQVTPLVPKIYADPDLLDLAFINLIGNAAKYAKDTPIISIDVHADETNLCIHIHDQGIGIPKEDLDHIFQRFYTVDKARSRKLGGSGLGLAIVKTIIEKHGGQISLSSQVGHGSTFSIHLPIKRNVS